MHDYKEDICLYLSCKMKLRLGCKAELRLRKSKRYINDWIQIPVYEIASCNYHNHEIEAYPCITEHDHQLLDRWFESQELAEEYVKELRSEYTYDSRETVKSTRTYFACREKECKAHFHVFLSKLNDYRVKGCLNHSHDSKKNKANVTSCPMDHQHQFIELEFDTKEEFQAYFEESDLENQFTKTSSHVHKSYYRCLQFKDLYTKKYQRKLAKKVEVEKFDCKITLIVLGPHKTQTNWTLKGCIAHNHEITKNRIPTKIRKEAFIIMSNMGLEENVKQRNYRKFRDTVLQLRQKHGSAFLDQMTIEDIMFDSQSMCFSEAFMQRFPGQTGQLRPRGKGCATKLRVRRERKRKKILEQIQILKNKLDAMEHSEENEVFLDKTLSALKEIPGISDEYLHQQNTNPDQSRVQPNQNQGIVIVPEADFQVPVQPSAYKKRKIVQEIPDSNIEYHFVTPDEEFQAVQNITVYDEVNGSYAIRME